MCFSIISMLDSCRLYGHKQRRRSVSNIWGVQCPVPFPSNTLWTLTTKLLVGSGPRDPQDRRLCSLAHITPIWKKGDPTDPLNYRPVVLTCSMCKPMEPIVKDQLLSYLLGKHLISRHQHAFVIKHSTTTSL